MAIALVSHVSAQSTDQANVTTGAIDTTGATLIVINTGQYRASAFPALSDNKFNLWTGRTVQDSGTFAGGIIYDCDNPTVGSGHTFSLNGAASFPSLEVAAFSGTLVSGAFDQQNGAASAAATSLATGSATPSAAGEVIIAGYAAGGTNSGQTCTDASLTFINTDIQAGDANSFGSGMYYCIESGITAANPTIDTGIGTVSLAVMLATYKAATTGASFLPYPRWAQLGPLVAQ